MGKQYKDTSVISKQLVWALLTYSDGSQFCFQTTLNSGILREYDVVLEEGKLVRLDKKYYWNGRYVYRQFPFAGAKISLWDRMTYTHPESARLRDFL